MMKKSPSGSLCPYYYKGGELHPLKYGNYRNDSYAFISMLNAEENFILNSHGGRNIWIDLYNTDMNAEQTKKLALHICAIRHKISRLALVGCSKKIFKTIENSISAQDCSLTSNIQHFKDPEIAKDWLVGKLIL